jgi:molecular chaperone HtpG
MRDRKFYDRAKDALLLKLTDGRYVTHAQYLESAKETHENVVYYTSDVEAQAQYVSLFEREGLEVAVLDKLIDSQFIQMMENYDSTVKFKRIDADVADALTKDADTVENEALTALFRRVANDDKLEVKYQSLKDESLPAMLTLSEESRRMEEMMKLYAMQNGGLGGTSMFPQEYTLVVNTTSPLYARLCELSDSDGDRAELIARQIYRLSVLSQRKLTADELKEFLSGSFDLLGKL